MKIISIKISTINFLKILFLIKNDVVVFWWLVKWAFRTWFKLFLFKIQQNCTYNQLSQQYKLSFLFCIPFSRLLSSNQLNIIVTSWAMSNTFSANSGQINKLKLGHNINSILASELKILKFIFHFSLELKSP